MAEHCITEGHLLGGRVRHAQPAKGFRSGIEPVLLAAAIPARPGERVIEAGCGAGATLLCLAARVAGVRAFGVERDAALVALAVRNAAANAWPELRFIAADIAAVGEPGFGAFDHRAFDHACANPPYHPGAGTASSQPGRDAAKRAPAGLFGVWASALAAVLRLRGTLTFIVSAAALPACQAAFAAAGCNPTALLPLWPKGGRPAKLVLLRGVKGGGGPFRVLPGLVLHAADGAYTAEAEAVLRHGDALAL